MASIALYLRREASVYLIQPPARTPPRGPFGSGQKKPSDLSYDDDDDDDDDDGNDDTSALLIIGDDDALYSIHTSR